MDEKILIKCPVCGREYLPCEIYLPDDFLGTARNIIRDDKHIIYFDGENMNLCETYICDDCGATFNIEASVSFRTTKEEKYDFEDEYTTTLD